MSEENIAFGLRQLKTLNLYEKSVASTYRQETPETPEELTKRTVHYQLAQSDIYRSGVLRSVTTFAGLSKEAISTAAQCFETLDYVCGDVIIQQDDYGDSFYIIQEGLVSVTRKTDPHNANEVAREIVQLSSNSHFGEISLLTAEPRSATVTVISKTAKLLRMTKAHFDQLLAETNKIKSASRLRIGKDVLDTVPLFKGLVAMVKKRLLEAMVHVVYQPGSYICRQNTIGQTFFIVTEGTCSVAVNSTVVGGAKCETEISKLLHGDHFGEMALIETANRRAANVVSLDTVSCLTLSRFDFKQLLASLKVSFKHNFEGPQTLRHGSLGLIAPVSNSRPTSAHLAAVRLSVSEAQKQLSEYRRISGYDCRNQREDARVMSILKRFAKFTTESLWNSLYSRMYRRLLLRPTAVEACGPIASDIIEENDTRFHTVTEIGRKVVRILSTDNHCRTVADSTFIRGFLQQPSDLRDVICRDWPASQYADLAKIIRFTQVKAFQKIVDTGTKGDCAFLILRGCVRIFIQPAQQMVQGRKTIIAEKYTPLQAATTVTYVRDLFPGEVFAEDLLESSSCTTYTVTAQAITDVDLATIDRQGFALTHQRKLFHMDIHQRFEFLQSVSLFKHWEPYRVMQVAAVLTLQEVSKGDVILSRNEVSKHIYFVVNGQVNVVNHTGTTRSHTVAVLSEHDYCGESCIINKFTRKQTTKVSENYSAVASVHVNMLVLSESQYTLFDNQTVERMRTVFLQKCEWRSERARLMKAERLSMRRYQRDIVREIRGCSLATDFAKARSEQGRPKGDSTASDTTRDSNHNDRATVHMVPADDIATVCPYPAYIPPVATTMASLTAAGKVNLGEVSSFPLIDIAAPILVPCPLPSVHNISNYHNANSNSLLPPATDGVPFEDSLGTASLLLRVAPDGDAVTEPSIGNDTTATGSAAGVLPTAIVYARSPPPGTQSPTSVVHSPPATPLRKLLPVNDFRPSLDRAAKSPKFSTPPPAPAKRSRSAPPVRPVTPTFKSKTTDMTVSTTTVAPNRPPSVSVTNTERPVQNTKLSAIVYRPATATTVSRPPASLAVPHDNNCNRVISSLEDLPAAIMGHSFDPLKVIHTFCHPRHVQRVRDEIKFGRIHKDARTYSASSQREPTFTELYGKGDLWKTRCLNAGGSSLPGSTPGGSIRPLTASAAANTAVTSIQRQHLAPRPHTAGEVTTSNSFSVAHLDGFVSQCSGNSSDSWAPSVAHITHRLNTATGQMNDRVASRPGIPSATLRGSFQLPSKEEVPLIGSSTL